MIRQPWPHSTSDFPAVPLRTRGRFEDFLVEEISDAPDDGGDHLWLEIEKVGITTREAVRRLARALNVPPRAIGSAGSKDARAVTRQMLSVEHVEPAQAESIDLQGVRVLRVGHRRRKLRIGQLRGNRFVLKLRDVPDERYADLCAVLEQLSENGVPNYFGPQRFGVRGDTWIVGRALLHGDFAVAASTIAGTPSEHDNEQVNAARELFDRGEYEAAAQAWPRGFPDCQRLCNDMARHGGDPEHAVRSLDRGLLRFFVSSYQSWLFNKVVAERIEALNSVLVGDLAWKHDSGAVFRVEDLARESARARLLEISPSGPLFGRRMSRPTGAPAEIEARILQRAGEDPELFCGTGPWGWRGGRRPLRVPLKELGIDSGVDDAGPFVEVRFVLPPGSYATTVLAEIGKDLLLDSVAEREEPIRNRA